MGPQRCFGIYVGFTSVSIINYIEPLTSKLFTTCFVNCHFDESIFLSIGGDKSLSNNWHEISWNAPSMLHLDPHTKQSKFEV